MGAAARFGYANLDFDAGYTPTLLENGEVRLSAGVRGLRYHDEHSVDKLGDIDPDDYTYARYFGAFHGIGPRIGAEAVVRQEDGRFGFSGLFSAAALYGLERRKLDVDGDITRAEEYRTVFNLEGSLGLDYYLDDEATRVTLGYRGEAFSGVGPGLATSDIRFVHGPTIKLSGTID